MKKISLILCLLMVSGFVQAKQTEASLAPKAEQEIVALAPEHFKPAFTKATVIKMNAIVQRSLDVINEYDSIIAEIKNNADPNNAKQLERINDLSMRSKLVLKDMLAAEKELKESDEVYNSAIFAGMKDFVSDVEREISTQSELLTLSLTK